MNPCAKRQLKRRYEQNVKNCNGTVIVEPEWYIKFLKIQRITDITESIQNRYNYCLFCGIYLQILTRLNVRAFKNDKISAKLNS